MMAQLHVTINELKDQARMAQLCEIEATNTLEDSNTRGETNNKPSDDKGGVFCISTAPQNPTGTVAAALAQNAHHTPKSPTRMTWNMTVVRPSYPTTSIHR